MNRYLMANGILVALLALPSPGVGQVPLGGKTTGGEWGRELAHPDKEVRRKALERIHELGPGAAAAVPALIDRLGHADWYERDLAVDALGAIGAPARDAIPGLATALEDVHVRQQAVFALGRIGAEAVPAVVAVLRAKEGRCREAAAEALGLIGPPARPAIPDLARTARDPDRFVRWWSLHALGNIQPAEASVVAVLREALKDTVADVRAKAVRLLAAGSAHGQTVALLLPILKDEDSEVRAEAVAAIGRSKPKAETVVPALLETLHDPEMGVRFQTARVLQQVDPEAEVTVRSLLAAVDQRGCSCVVDGCHLVEAHGESAATRLVALLRNGPPRERQAAAVLLGVLAVDSGSVRPALEQAEADADVQVRKAAAEAIRRLRQKSPR